MLLISIAELLIELNAKLCEVPLDTIFFTYKDCHSYVGLPSIGIAPLAVVGKKEHQHITDSVPKSAVVLARKGV
jgi:hypothetical protein